MASNSTNPLNRPIIQPRGAGRLRESTGGSGAPSSSASRLDVQSREQTFDEQQRQLRAATILESNEMLVWASMEMCEVINQKPRLDIYPRKTDANYFNGCCRV
jgi:hypothetical protein